MMMQIIEVLRALEYVQGSHSLTPEEKLAITNELKATLPAKLLCHKAQRTHEIVTDLLVRANGTGTSKAEVQASAAPENSPNRHKRPAGSPHKNGFSRNAVQDAGRA